MVTSVIRIFVGTFGNGYSSEKLIKVMRMAYLKWILPRFF